MDADAIVAEAGEDLLATRAGVVGFEFAAVEPDRTAVSNLDDVAGVYFQGVPQAHVQVAVEEVAEQLGRVVRLSRGLPGEVVGDGAVEGQGVQTVPGSPIAADAGEGPVEAVEIDGGEPRGGVGDDVVRQGEVGGAHQVDPVTTRVINGGILDLDHLAVETGGKDAVQAAAGQRHVAGDRDRLEAGGHQRDVDPVAAVTGEPSPADRQR